MGEVYRAFDRRLGREVAIKVLPDHFARDAERLARFEREARLLATLNHSNIAAIYGLEEQDGLRFLVLELVPGKTLAETLTVRPFAVEDALQFAIQIAEAIEAAHEKGIVHRDLKPANIKITPDGRVKVLDFGLAKGLGSPEPASDHHETPTAAYEENTREGAVLGTAPYMSPEQARGRFSDRRSDIWAFGCVFYEMLTCRRAFPGETHSDTIAAILRAVPDWSAIPHGAPPRAISLLQLCLSKDPVHRLRDAGDVRIEIEEALRELSVSPKSAPASRRYPVWLIGPISACLAACLAVASFIMIRAAAPPTPPVVWSGDRLMSGSLSAFEPRVSPDGQMIVFQVLVDGMSQLALMKTGSANWTVLTHERSRGPVFHSTWAADGTKIYFDRVTDFPNAIYSVPAMGGDERLVLDGASTPESLPEGDLLVARREEDGEIQLYRYFPNAGNSQAIGPRLRSDNTLGANFRVFPGGKSAVFYGTLASEAEQSFGLHVLDLSSGSTRRLLPKVLFEPVQDRIPLAVDPSGDSVILDLPIGDLHRICRVALKDGEPVTLVTMTISPYSIDVASDGSLYVGTYDRPLELLRVPLAGGTPERLSPQTFTKTTGAVWTPVEFPDGHVLLPSVVSGRSQLLVVRPGKEPRPFVDTREETDLPATLIGNDLTALVIGTPPQQAIALAATDGRIVRRLQGVREAAVMALGAAPDGRTIYYLNAGKIWSIPIDDGEPREISTGNSFAVDPQGKSLIVQRTLRDGVRLFRVPLLGGDPEAIHVESDLRIVSMPIVDTAMAEDGRIVVTAGSKDSWFWGPAVLDPKTGQLKKVPINYDGDILPSTWARNGDILGMGLGLKTELWHFRPLP
jgi:serine/threonine protein kinase